VVSPAAPSPAATYLCSITHEHFVSRLVVHPTGGNNILHLTFTNSSDSISSTQIVDNLPGTDHEFSINISLWKSCTYLLAYCKRVIFVHLRSFYPMFLVNFQSEIEAWTYCKDLLFIALTLLYKPNTQ